MPPLVSIIIPVYNSERFLSSALSAINKQTYLDREIIIVDDASTDRSYEIAKSFESEFCKVIRQENSGAAVARNTGLAHASGDYVQFLDVDDFLSEDKIGKQVEALEGQSNKVAVCDHIDFFNEEELTSKVRQTDQSSFIYSTDDPAGFLINLYGGYGNPHFIQTNSWLVPRSIIERVGGWRCYRCPDDDGEFFARILLASEGIVHVPGVYNFYRRSTSESNLSQSTSKKYLQNTLLTIDLKYSYLRQQSINPAIAKAIATQYLIFAVSVFPKHKVLFKIAYKRYSAFNKYITLPVLGGKFIEVIKSIFGWKTARLLKYYLRGS